MRLRRASMPQRRGGFSLLEVILALAIFVASAAILSRLVLLGIENAEYSREQTEAMMIAETRWAEIEAGILDPTAAGSFASPEFPDWQCTIGANIDQNSGLYLVQIEITKPAPPPAQGHTLRLTRLWFDESQVAAASQEALP